MFDARVPRAKPQRKIWIIPKIFLLFKSYKSDKYGSYQNSPHFRSLPHSNSTICSSCFLRQPHAPYCLFMKLWTTQLARLARLGSISFDWILRWRWWHYGTSHSSIPLPLPPSLSLPSIALSLSRSLSLSNENEREREEERNEGNERRCTRANNLVLYIDQDDKEKKTKSAKNKGRKRGYDEEKKNTEEMGKRGEFASYDPI